MTNVSTRFIGLLISSWMCIFT